MHISRSIPTLTIALTAGLLAACSDDGTSVDPPSNADAVVSIDDNDFDPGTTEVAVGDTVAWLFEDGTKHDVSFDEGPASPVQKTGTWSRTFDEPGTYDYVCTLHRNMTGSVVVTED